MKTNDHALFEALLAAPDGRAKLLQLAKTIDNNSYDDFLESLYEKIGEIFIAIENEDKVEFLDAVVDGLVVVGYEYYIKGGYKPEYLIELEEFEKECIFDIVFEYIKPYYEGTYSYEITLSWLEELFNQLNIDHMKAVNEVLESNWSKFPTITEFGECCYGTNYWNISFKEGALKYQIEEIEKQGRYVDIYHELRYDESVGEERVIFWAKGENKSDGSVKEFKAPKYVKPTATFKEPDFASCWLN